MKSSFVLANIPDYCYTLLKVHESVNYSLQSPIRREDGHEKKLFEIAYSSYGSCRPDVIRGFESDRPCRIVDNEGNLVGTCSTELNLEEPIKLSGMVWPRLFVSFDKELGPDESTEITVHCSVQRKIR
jgi:hypothetical protein